MIGRNDNSTADIDNSLLRIQKLEGRCEPGTYCFLEVIAVSLK